MAKKDKKEHDNDSAVVEEVLTDTTVTVEEDVIIYTNDIKPVVETKEEVVKGDVTGVKPTDLVWVQRKGYKARCLKSWADARGYEVIAKA